MTIIARRRVEAHPMNLIAYRELVRAHIPVREAQNLVSRVVRLARRRGDESDEGMRIAAREIAARHSGWIVFVLDPCTITPRKDFPPVRVFPSEREANHYVARAARYGLASRIEWNPKRRAWTAHDPSAKPRDPAFLDCGADLRDPPDHENASDERPHALSDRPAHE
jgi:hypothetical protein